MLVAPSMPLAGQGLHSGRRARLQLLPAPAGSGLVISTPRGPIRVSLDAATPAARQTVLRTAGARVETVEHLLAALAALGIWDARVELQGFPEIPILDGSAAPFVRVLLGVSEPVSDAGGCWRVVRPFSCRFELASCHLLPAPTFELECAIDFASPLIGAQRVRLEGQEQLLRRIVPARSFGFIDEARALRRAGLARGATLRSVVVFDGDRVLNPGGTRFRDEPARHKLLDALGDLALLGGPLVGRVRLERPGHRMIVTALRRAVARGALRHDPGHGDGGDGPLVSSEDSELELGRLTMGRSPTT